jgi:hypothetical protein
MTAAGLALIAGGLATLISFRSVLFGSGERRSRRRQRGALEAPRRRPALESPAEPEPEPEPEREPEPELAPVVHAEPIADEVAEAVTPRRRGRRGRRRALPPAGAQPIIHEEPERGGLASIGLADEDDEVEVEPVVHVEADETGEDEVAEVADEVESEDSAEPEPVFARSVDRSDRGYGDRVEGWVRPEYQTPADEPRPGEYWTPIPVDLGGDPEPSAKGYGWPLPVERLPAVPSYEPATGFDMAPVTSEPTELVAVWDTQPNDRPGRIRLPRSWSNRNEKVMRDEEPRRRPRPRPRPEEPIDTSTVYVSRHAAEPPR